jgi:hypothetical protein
LPALRSLREGLTKSTWAAVYNVDPKPKILIVLAKRPIALDEMSECGDSARRKALRSEPTEGKRDMVIREIEVARVAYALIHARESSTRTPPFAYSSGAAEGAHQATSPRAAVASAGSAPA